MTDQEMQRSRIRMLKQEMLQRAALFARLVDRYGPGVLDMVTENTVKEAREQLQRADLPARDLDTVMEVLWDQMGDLAEFTVEERSPERLELRVTRCLFADEMRRLGAADIGLAFYCAYDDGFCQGLNPAMTFTRTRTLMQGDECCDHTYELMPSSSTSGTA